MLFCERYRIERRIDEGGMATIYQAVDETSGLPVAIKILFAHYSDNTVVKARFLDEGRIQAMLKHPNIVHVYQVVREPLLCFVMEYVDGETLDEYLQRKAPLSEREIVELLMPVMSAVGFAHSKGIVHRDLKPSNVLLQTTSGYAEPKVMDFGVAKVSRGKELTADGTTVGTLHYMSPEQIVGSRNIDGRADIYSLGCSLYKLCTGEVPFNASSEFALMMAQVEAPPTPPSELRPDLSPEMEEIILRALAKEPENRFQSIKEMTQALIKIGDETEPSDTITRPMPADLLEFALAADEVALDQTDQFRLEYLASGADTLEVDGADSSPGMTVELSTSAVRKIERDRVKALRRKAGGLEESSQAETQERKPPKDTNPRQIDETTTLPFSESGDDFLPTTTERARPEVEELDDDDFDDVMETIPMSAGMKAWVDDEPEGVVAVDKPGVDSKEVTHVHIPKGAHEELRATSEHTRSQRLEVLVRPEDDVDETDDADISASTAAERPSLRKLSTLGNEGSETVDSETVGSETVETAEVRPSKRISELRREHREQQTRQKTGSGPHQLGDDHSESTAAERPALRALRAPTDIGINDSSESSTTSGSRPQKTVDPEVARAQTDVDADKDTQKGGVLWIAIGVVALLMALLVLGWVIWGR